MSFRILELYSGIGGCAAAAGLQAQITAAVDIDQDACAIYRQNFASQPVTCSLESVTPARWRQWQADLWWMSPPCQPYTVRGKRRDLADPRASSLCVVIDQLARCVPRYVALENVPGFVGSQAHARLRQALQQLGYAVLEQLLCPTQLGVPNRRRRFYLVAARGAPLQPPPIRPAAIALGDYLLADVPEDLWVASDWVRQYRSALHVVEAADPQAVTSCFTSAYGRSFLRSGSYLQTAEGVRRFAPREILRLLGFPRDFTWPDHLARRRQWALVGNSVSVTAVRHVLAAIPELAELARPIAFC